ncbi:MAG: twin-arginine translocase subunit TatC [Polynucleobacter sp.]|nr:MAG: twin-arginine translocase subunit TatC [Polynucleobacter sp.]
MTQNTNQDSPNVEKESGQEDGVQETFLSHLFELRDRLIKSVGAMLFVFLGLVYWAPEIFHLFSKPLLDALPNGGRMIVTDVTGSFFVPMKVTMLVAFLGALPFIMYQLWAFIAPGLYKHERQLILPIVTSSYVLFVSGMAFAYFLVFPTVFQFMAHYNAPLGADMATDIDKYLSFAMTTFLAFGLTFEVPVVVVVLVKLGMVRIKKLKEIRPYVIVGAFVIAAVVTPPDILSQLLLAIPLCLLYELGILVARFYEPKLDPEDEVAEAAE